MRLRHRINNLKKKTAVIYLVLKNKETPVFTKLMAAITVAYALSPIDLIPDFIPVLGYIDDFIILPILISLTLRLVPNRILHSCEKEAEDIWRNGKPKRWYYAIPILVIWFILLVVILQRLMN